MQWRMTFGEALLISALSVLAGFSGGLAGGILVGAMGIEPPGSLATAGVIGFVLWGITHTILLCKAAGAAYSSCGLKSAGLVSAHVAILVCLLAAVVMAVEHAFVWL